MYIEYDFYSRRSFHGRIVWGLTSFAWKGEIKEEGEKIRDSFRACRVARLHVDHGRRGWEESGPICFVGGTSWNWVLSQDYQLPIDPIPRASTTSLLEISRRRRTVTLHPVRMHGPPPQQEVRQNGGAGYLISRAKCSIHKGHYKSC